MTRRDFIASLSSISILLATGVVRPSRLFAAPRLPDLALIKGGLPDRMFDLGIAALGGAAGIGAFLKVGALVAIKPNVSWSAPPEQGATTDPRLIGRIVEHCLAAGARKVLVADHTISDPTRAYELSGIGEAVKLAGGQVVPANAQRYYQKERIPDATVLHESEIHEIFLEADLIINVPVLKHHGSTGITAGLKNLMGTVWNRQTYHRIGLHQAIADFALRLTPQLTVIDAFRVMSSGGPRGSSSAASVTEERVQILSADPVAADAAAALTWGTVPERIPHITMAAALGLGSAELEALRIERIRA